MPDAGPTTDEIDRRLADGCLPAVDVRVGTSANLDQFPVLTMPPLGRNTAPVVPSDNPLAPVNRDFQELLPPFAPVSQGR